MTQEVPDNREWLSYKEAQLLTGYGRTTLSKLVNNGIIFASMCGRAVRIERTSLRNYMLSHAHEAVKGSPHPDESDLLENQK